MCASVCFHMYGYMFLWVCTITSVYVCIYVMCICERTCVCACVVSAKGPLSLPGQTVLSPLDRWPTPSLSSSLHLTLPLSLYHCLPLLQPPKHPITSIPRSLLPSIPLSHYTSPIINQSRDCAPHSNLSHFDSQTHFLSSASFKPKEVFRPKTPFLPFILMWVVYNATVWTTEDKRIIRNKNKKLLLPFA